MASKELTPVAEYAAVAANTTQIVQTIRENLAGEQIGEFDLDRVKMPAGGGTSWEVPTLDGSEAVRELVGVIAFTKQARSYWREPYSGENTPPDCSSPDGQEATATGGFTPPATQGSHGRYYCESCALAQWGSADGDSRGQACKLSRQVFLLTPEALLPLVVSLPPTSLAPAKKFFQRLASHAIPYREIVTKITLEKVSGSGVPDYSRAVFSAGERLTPEQVSKVREYSAALEPIFLSTRVVERTEAEPEAKA